MKINKIKMVLSFLMMAFIGSIFSMQTFAAESSIVFEENQMIVFEPGSAYTSTDLFDNFKNVMPGDSKKEIISVSNKNTDFDYIKVYMRALVHNEERNPLSDKVVETGETVASMKDFLSQLSMTIYNETEKIFDAAPNQLNGLAENVYLGSMRKGESLDLNVTLKVPIELENNFKNRTGEVDWVFVIEGFDNPTLPVIEETVLTVRKLWEDDGVDRPKNVMIQLIENDEFVEEIELNAANQWTYAWGGLTEKSEWSAVETDVPSGYDADYTQAGNILAITNTKREVPVVRPSEPVNLSVKKVWDNHEKKHPESVKVTLSNGVDAVETVGLGEWNNWIYEWKDLDGEGNWQVTETSIPKGYTPIYRVNENLVIITNTETLIQTGQFNWPIWILIAVGLIFLVIGYFMKQKEKKKAIEHA